MLVTALSSEQISVRTFVHFCPNQVALKKQSSMIIKVVSVLVYSYAMRIMTGHITADKTARHPQPFVGSVKTLHGHTCKSVKIETNKTLIKH